MVVVAMHQLARHLHVWRIFLHKLAGAIVEQGLDRIHGDHFGLNEGIGVILRFLELGEFLLGESSPFHQLGQGDSFSVGPGLGFACRHEIPVDALVMLRPGLLAVADIEDIHVLLFIFRVAGDDIGACKTRQVVGALPQLVRQQEGLIAQFIGSVERFLGLPNRVQGCDEKQGAE